mmetsp:Transcript_93587/g.270377  ORF Transcript_93587/g.270377 Transcript_93587/m.270377 type:complete len:278 (-) Transcript_93587:55-888(-)
MPGGGRDYRRPRGLWRPGRRPRWRCGGRCPCCRRGGRRRRRWRGWLRESRRLWRLGQCRHNRGGRCGRATEARACTAGDSMPLEGLVRGVHDAVPDLHLDPIPSAVTRNVQAPLGVAAPMDVPVVPRVCPLEVKRSLAAGGEKHKRSILIVVPMDREAKLRVLAPPDQPVAPRDELLARVPVNAVRGHQPGSGGDAIHCEALLRMALPPDLTHMLAQREERRVGGGRGGWGRPSGRRRRKRWRRRRLDNNVGPRQRHVADDGLGGAGPWASLGAAWR